MILMASFYELKKTVSSLHGMMKSGRVFTLLLLLTGCTSQPETRPPYQLRLTITPNVNESAPLKIDVMLLKSKETFMSADFFALQGNAKDALGDKLVNEDRYFILPTERTRTWPEQNQPDINYIGIIAEYRNLEGKQWRLALPAPHSTKPPFYQFWRSAPKTLPVCLKVTGTGLSPDETCAAWTEEHHE